MWASSSGLAKMSSGLQPGTAGLPGPRKSWAWIRHLEAGQLRSAPYALASEAPWPPCCGPVATASALRVLTRCIAAEWTVPCVVDASTRSLTIENKCSSTRLDLVDVRPKCGEAPPRCAWWGPLASLGSQVTQSVGVPPNMFGR
mmetsp:Transcript_50381/g.133820  ORF Transcript_50381/g.133820 Transcript_50381/m.133820 type:complete len:144 (-) Transcript_50381:191-622(-)